MKKTIGLLSLLLALSALAVTTSAQQTKLLTAEKHNEYGLVYSLPVTALEVEISAIRTVKKAGPYYKYTNKFLGTSDVVTEDAELWTIESVEIRPYGIPDPDSRYLMQLKAGALTFIAVDEDGMLLAINKETDSRPAIAPKASVMEEKIIPGDKEYLEYVNEDFMAAQSSFTQARILAEELAEVKDAKISLTRGTAETMPTDGRQLELMLNSLSRQEAALTAAFTGTVTKERVTRSFTFTPEDNARTVLARLSSFAGFVDANDYSGDPIYIDIEITQEGELPVDAKGEEKKLPKDAVAYCIPGAAKVSISWFGKTLFSQEIEMSQFGVVFGLNPSIFTDKKEPSYAIFDPATGALRELGVAK